MTDNIHEGYKMTPLGELPEEWEVEDISKLLSLEYGEGLAERERTGNGYPVYGSNGIVGFHKEYLLNPAFPTPSYN
jgi:type I restriction enzyme S subunit